MRRGIGVLGVAVLSLNAANGFAQVRASERALVRQTINGTTIEVDYARPRMRGRAGIFGQEVHWQEVWTPGANMATTLEVSGDIQLNGQRVPRGKYSVWMVVRQGAWTVLLDSTVDRFHMNRPDPEQVPIRFDLTPETRPRQDVLTWSFPQITNTGGILAMHWDTLYVPMSVKVESPYSLTVRAEAARPIVGRYEMRWLGPPEPGSDGGPTLLNVTYERGSLFSSVNPPPFPGYDTFVLLPLRDDWFIPGWWREGDLYDADDSMVMEFTLEAGTATGFTMRLKNDQIIGTGLRVQ